MLAEKSNRGGPCLAARGGVGGPSNRLRLSSQESVTGTWIDFRPEAPARRAHSGISGTDGRVHPIVIAAIQSQYWRMNGAEIGIPGRGAVIDDGGIEVWRAKSVLK